MPLLVEEQDLAAIVLRVKFKTMIRGDYFGGECNLNGLNEEPRAESEGKSKSSYKDSLLCLGVRGPKWCIV